MLNPIELPVIDDLGIISTIDSAIDAIETPQEAQGDVISMPDRQPSHHVKKDAYQCTYGTGVFTVDKTGVQYTNTDGDPKPLWICTQMAVVANTRDSHSSEWGRLLRWRDKDGVSHVWAMPLELLQGDGSDVRRELARQGLVISPNRKARDLLAAYIQTWLTYDRVRCVDRLGWHGTNYVTPGETIGDGNEIVVYQSTQSIEPAFSISGTAEDWRKNVSSMVAGNSRLIFAVNVALAAPLLDLTGEDSGGFHLVGTSSTGKSTALKISASIWGSPAHYPRLWRATANGLEGLAALHNDGLLILDELAQADPKEAGEAAYMLANGQGKTRAGRTGAARQSASWRLLFLSAGEITLTSLMATVGKKSHAGQEIRLAEIEADAGAGLGLFEDLHDVALPDEFAVLIKDRAIQHHGAVGLAWLRYIVANRPAISKFVSDGVAQFVADVVPRDAGGQVSRVARRFGLVAIAGEIATHQGLTGWHDNDSIDAAKKCFTSWLDGFGGVGNREERAILDHVRGFFEQHGASRFEDVTATHDQRIINRVGYYRTGDNGDREYLVLPVQYKIELCKGFSQKIVTSTLTNAGWLLPDKSGKAAQTIRIGAHSTSRLYVFNSNWSA